MMERNLPIAWAFIDLGFFMKKGTGSVNPTLFPREEFDLYSIPAYDSLTPERVFGSQIGSAKKVVQENDVLLSRIVPHIQRSWIVGGNQGRRQVGSGEWIIFDGSDLSTSYLRFFLLSYDFHQKFMKTISGVGGSLTRANPNLTADFQIPLPPLAEQHRIVARIEELFSSLDKGVESLKTAREQLKVYRQAVLKAAFKGEFTKKNRVNGKYPAIDILLNELDGSRELNLVKLKYPDIDIREELPEQPIEWTWIRNEALLKYVTSGSRDWKQFYSNSGSLFIRTQDINSNYLDLTDAAYVSLPKKVEGKRSLVEPGDILMTITGANVGRVAIIPTDIEEAYVSQSVALMKLLDKRLTKYLWYYFQSRTYGEGLIGGLVYGVGRPVLSLENMREVPVSLCSVEEQKDIIDEIESRLSVCDKIEESIEQSLQQAEALRQSILKKAFEGKLVPQDPSDEPASVLLERIRAQRQTQVNKKTTKTTKKSLS